MQDTDFQTAGSSVEGVNQIQRPANQFPTGFQPMIEARTVNAGGVVKTSKQTPKLIKLFSTSDDAPASKLGLKAEYAEDKNSIEDDLPVELKTNSTAK